MSVCSSVPGAPEGLRAVVTGPTTILVTWSPPRPHTGTILHYTLYSSGDDQVRGSPHGHADGREGKDSDCYCVLESVITLAIG